MSNIGTFWGNQALRYMFLNSGTVWASLHTSNPGASGNPATEVVGNDYERIECAMTVPNGKITANRDILVWDNMPYVTVRYAGLWSDDTGGDIFAYASFPSPIQVQSGSDFIIPAYKFAVAL